MRSHPFPSRGCCHSGCRCRLFPPAPSTHWDLPAGPRAYPQAWPLRRALIAFFSLVLFCSFRFCCSEPLSVYNFFLSTKLLPWRVKNLDQRKQQCLNFYRTFYYFLKCAMSIHTTLLRKPSAQVLPYPDQHWELWFSHLFYLFHRYNTVSLV